MAFANWSPVAYYLVNDVVFYNGVAYEAVNPSFNSPPPGADWSAVPVGDIEAVLAGTGLGGGGTSGVITLTNDGVRSWNLQTGDVETAYGCWYKTSTQTIAPNANPTFPVLTWDTSTTQSDTTTISQVNSTTFQVNAKGIYLIEFNVVYGIGASATFGDTLHFANIRLSRGGSAFTSVAQISQNISGYNALLPTSRANQVQAMIELEGGDQLQFQTLEWLTAGTWNFQPQAGGGFGFDLNTYWAWTLVKPF